MANAEPFVKGRLKRRQVVVFSKSYSPEGKICEHLLKDYQEYLHDDIFEWVNIEKRSDCSQVEDYLWLLSGKNNREVPLMFIKQHFVGGYSEIMQMHNDNKLVKLLENLKLGNDKIFEEDNDLVNGKDIETSQITIRVLELDDAELLIKISDSLQSKQVYVDYDAELMKKNPDAVLSEMRMLFSMEDKGKVNIDITGRNSQELEDERAEWMVLNGQRLTIGSGTLSNETSSFIMKKVSKSQQSTKSDSGSLKNDVISIKSYKSSVMSDIGSVKNEMLSIKSDTGSVKNEVLSVKSNIGSVKDDTSVIKSDYGSVKKNSI